MRPFIPFLMLGVFLSPSCHSPNLANVRDDGWRLGVCPVHEVSMAIEPVIVWHGFAISPSDMPGPRFQAAEFPFAQWYLMNDDTLEIDQRINYTTGVYRCHQCERAKLEWIAHHPDSNWSKQELLAYEQLTSGKAAPE